MGFFILGGALVFVALILVGAAGGASAPAGGVGRSVALIEAIYRAAEEERPVKL